VEGELKTSAYHVTGVWTAIKLHALALPLLLLISGEPSEKSKARECAAKPIRKETEISNPQISNRYVRACTVCTCSFKFRYELVRFVTCLFILSFL